MGVLVEHADLFWAAFLKSLGICAWGAAGAVVLGTIIAVCRICPVAPLRAFGSTWVSLVRNCPLTVVMFFFAFGLPELGINGSYYVFGVAALVVYTSAFVCEAIRSGVNAVPQGQAEAARALGLPFSLTMREVVMPQAMRSCIPPLGSVLIAMIKNSAVVGIFGVPGDLYSVGESLTSAQGYAALPVLLGVALGYLALTLPAAGALGWVERKVVVVR